METQGNYSYRIDPRRFFLTLDQIREMEETRLFYDRLRRRPWVTLVLLIVIIGFWVLSLIIGSGDEAETLVRMGAKINFLVDHGQPWRLISPIFLHFGILHIIFNGYALYMLGQIIENVYGRRRYILIFFISGVLSVVASYLGSNRMSVGASGAIFGLLGAGVVVGYKYRSDIPPVFRRYFGRGMLPWVFLNLALGFFIDGIDNYAHVGGLIAGVVTSSALRPRIGRIAPEGLGSKLMLTFTSSIAVAVMLFTVFLMLENLIFEKPLPLPEPSEWRTVHSEATSLAARIPPGLIPVQGKNPHQGMQYIETTIGFWVTFEREPEKMVTFDQMEDVLRQELEDTGELKVSDLEISTGSDTQLAGLKAKHFELAFRLGEDPLRYTLEIWLAPSSGGLISASCSSPQLFHPYFKNWCAHFAESLTVQQLGPVTL